MMIFSFFYILAEHGSKGAREPDQDVHAILPKQEKEQASCLSLPAPLYSPEDVLIPALENG